MSVLGDIFSGPKAPPPPPPPPAPPTLAQPSIMEAGTAERQRMNAAAGSGMEGTDVTGGQGAANPQTTKSLLGG